MKTTLAVLGSLFCFAFAASGSESFTLNIPVRGDASQETGMVHVVLDLDGPAAGAQLVINGSTTVNLGQAIPVNTDFVRFIDAGDAVRIEYEPRSNFGADFCAGGGAVEKNIPMRFVGSQDVIEYRMASFVVASPAVECSRPSRRVADLPASITPAADGVAPELAATNRGRLPLDIVLVLDKSGSMSGVPPGAAAGATKVEILRSAVTTFVANWRELDQPTPDGGDASDDRIGVVFFDSTIAPQTLAGADPPASFFVRRGDAIPGAWQAVLDNIDTLTPGSATSIGGGVNEAMKQWRADPVNDLTLIVATDGMQNTPPLILPVGVGFLGLIPVSGLPEELRKRFIPIQTIGFGEPAAVDETLLRNVALETAGRSFIGVNAATVFDTFALTLVSILKGNTASLGLRQSGTLTAGAPNALHPVIVDRSVQRLVASVQWAPGLNGALDLEVFPPGVTPSQGAATPTSSERTAHAVIQSFDKPDVGTWQVRVQGSKSEIDPNTSLPYTLNGFFLERHLDYQVTTEPLRLRTGEPIHLRAEVSYGGKPLTRLPAGAIRVRVQRPAEGLGSILRATKTPTKATTNRGDVQSPLQQKIDVVSRKKMDRTRPRDGETITLVEQGRGVYTGTFERITTPGSYGFEVLLDWDDSRTGRVRRTDRLEQYVGVKPDPARTLVSMKRGADRTLSISVTPRDAFGNYLGPGHASLISAEVSGGGSLVAGPPIDRDLKGTYVFTMTDVTSKAPRVVIKVDGVTVGRR
ncbi:MAG: vWA domain-containing protein [Thermoanaerobaculia bacterium]